MKRLEFVRKMALGAGYVAVVGCASACMNKSGKTEEPAKTSAAEGFTIDLNDPKYTDLDKPGAYVYLNKLIIARTNEGQLVAYDKKCTHQGGPLTYNMEAGVFQCPWHGAQFTGKGNVKKGPATSNLKPYLVEKSDATVKITKVEG